MTPAVFSILFLTVLFSSFLAGILGMGGGILLLSVLQFFYPVKVVIPLHAFIQTVSNSSRVFMFSRHIEWKIVWRFLLLAPIGIYLGGLLWRDLNQAYLQIVVGLFIILSVMIQKIGKHFQLSANGFIILGFFAGFLGTIVGALGPVVAPFFHHSGLTKERFVATKACCQFVIHLLKIANFTLLLSYSYTEQIDELIILGLVAIAGTYLAKKTISKIPEALFVKIFRLMLGSLGLVMMVRGINAAL